jgi:hypothetical protein
MKHLRTAAVMVGAAVLFLIANRGAYKGFFSADDLNNLAWTGFLSASNWIDGLVSPWYSEANFRPVGHFVYGLLGRTTGLDFRPFVWLVHLVHLANVGLLWLVLRRMGAEQRGAAAAALLFAYHMACFDAYWKPMFLFDLLACVFCLLTLLLYLSPRWWMGLVTFWLAYKSKEIAAALPAFLAAYEYWAGGRRWLRVAPYAAISGWFTLQALAKRPEQANPYSLQFTPEAVWRTVSFYSSEILFLPFAGLVLIVVFVLSKQPMVRLGVAGTVLLMGPLWFLPQRLFSVYIYLPLVAAAVAVAFGTARWRTWVLAAIMAVWIPYNYMVMREKRKAALSIADENRAYVAAVGRMHAEYPRTMTVYSRTRPQYMESWGVEGAFRWYYRDAKFRVDVLEGPGARMLLAEPDVVVVGWNPFLKSLCAVRRDHAKEPARYEFGEEQPLWLLKQGWLWPGEKCRWTGPKATAELRRPGAATRFEATLNIDPRQIAEQGEVAVEAVVDGVALGVQRITSSGWQTARWKIGAGPEKKTEVELRFAKPYRMRGREREALGAAVVSFGFAE